MDVQFLSSLSLYCCSGYCVSLFYLPTWTLSWGSVASPFPLVVNFFHTPIQEKLLASVASNNAVMQSFHRRRLTASHCPHAHVRRNIDVTRRAFSLSVITLSVLLQRLYFAPTWVTFYSCKFHKYLLRIVMRYHMFPFHGKRWPSLTLRCWLKAHSLRPRAEYPSPWAVILLLWSPDYIVRVASSKVTVDTNFTVVFFPHQQIDEIFQLALTLLRPCKKCGCNTCQQ